MKGRVIYVNGRYRPYSQAAVHVEDRGYQFGDAVYEVIEIRNRQLVDATRHLARLTRSLNELSIPQPMSERALRHVIEQTILRNCVRSGSIYLQVSRGTAARDFLFPQDDPMEPSLVVIARAEHPDANDRLARQGIPVITHPDTRWARCDIKTVMLLPSSLAKIEARSRGAKEAWLFDEQGNITEGASSTAWIVSSADRLTTRQLGHALLPGVTRHTVMDILHSEGLEVEERPFTIAEAKAAREAFITSAGNIVMPVISIDGEPVADGKPGPTAMRLRALFHQFAEIAGSGATENRPI